MQEKFEKFSHRLFVTRLFYTASATTGHSECLTNAFSTSALGLETLLVNGLIDRELTIEFTGLWAELLDATLPTERDSGLCAPHFPTFG